MQLTKFVKIIPVISVSLFCIYTLAQIFYAGILPGEAVAHSWTIAGKATLFQIINLMNVEGHFIIWYLCLMPFAKFPQLYPWAIDIINWIFCLSAIIILWKKAPFNILTKIFITFSTPFLKIYAVYPRCYSIGILFLFLAMSFYQKRFSNPYKYLILLILAANTSILALFGAGVLGLMFLYEMIFQQKEYHFSKKVFLITSFCAIILNLILFYFQFHNVQVPDYETTKIIKAPFYFQAFFFQKEFFTEVNMYKVVLLWIAAILFPFILWKSKKAFIFFMATEVFTLLFFSFIYGARNYHACFLFIYAIISYWIFKSENKEEDKSLWKERLFTIICFGMIFINAKYVPAYADILIDEIQNDSVLMKAKLFSNIKPISIAVLLPYLDKTSQTIYDMNGRDLNSYDSLMLYFNRNAKIMNIEQFISSIDKNRRNFVITDGTYLIKHLKYENYEYDAVLYKVFSPMNYDYKIRIYEIKNLKIYN